MNEALKDELIAIDSIFPGSVSSLHGSETTWIVKIEPVSFYITFDAEYPARVPHLSTISGIERSVLEDSLQEGCECLFSLISAVQGFIEDGQSNGHPEKDDCPIEHDHPTTIGGTIEWSVGEAVQDRKSTMLGRACRVTCRAELTSALKHIEMDKKLQKASHPCIWVCLSCSIGRY